MENRIPHDPERMTFSNNDTIKKLQKYRHHVMSLIGSLTLRELEKRDLMVVPKDMFTGMLEKCDKDAFNAFKKEY